MDIQQSFNLILLVCIDHFDEIYLLDFLTNLSFITLLFLCEILS